MLPNKAIYTDWHKTFPGSGQGKQYPWLLDKIVQNHTQYSGSKLNRRERSKRWNTLLDYGCGKGGTARWLEGLVKKCTITLYDPGHELYRHTQLEKKYDCVYTTDVLEHIERVDIDGVIEHCQTLSEHNLHIVDMTPAKKRLPDGRNAHVLLLDTHQWIELFDAHTHTIEEVYPYTVPDKRFGTRERVCIWTRKSKEYIKR